MRKSKDITKYNPDWQIVRIFVKGQSTSLDDKLRITNDYFAKSQTLDAWERVVNWLEGLQMGYKAASNSENIQRIAVELSRYNGIKPKNREIALSDNDIRDRLANYPYNLRLRLLKDMFKTNKNWLVKGYLHKEHNHFMDLLYQVFDRQGEVVPSNVSKEKTDTLRKNSATLQNTHKFFF